MKLPKTAENDAKPKGLKETIISSTPVVLTVIATVLAGLSSSEMTKSQYYRATAAQNQSKASDQWAYYQAKRQRAVEANNTLDILAATSRPAVPTDMDILDASTGVATATSGKPGEFERLSPLIKELMDMLSSGKLQAVWGIPPELPSVTDKRISDENVLIAMDEVDRGYSEEQMVPTLKRISDDAMNQATGTANDNLAKFEAAVDPISSMFERLHAILAQEAAAAEGFWPQLDVQQRAASEIQAVQTDVAAARLRFAAARYDKEANYNRVSGQLLEVMVHRSGVASDRAKSRSTDFFFGMLAAQAGVVISTFALAVQRRSTFWALAATAGILALGFSSYVYLFT